MAEHQKYKITDRIDAGGMAEVFRGVAESLQGFKKNVAIKRILPHLTKNKKFISMFLDEARLSLHLQHANIVGVFDIGVSPAGPDAGGGAYFIVMEFVDGTHLKGMLESLRRQGRSLTVPQSLYIMMQVCNGLSYAHDVVDQDTGRLLGIVHRDVSPPNILLSKTGEVKLVDFGLAKATSQLESTDPGVVKGKFSYLSPEAANGKEVDRRADIFSVGILLYELLTGKRLFYGENDYQTVEFVKQARVPSIRQQNPDVEPELEAVVRRALARDVNTRYQTAGELQDAIAQYLFSRGLKVTSRDIADLVRGCVLERAKAIPSAPQPKSLINTLILEELNKFTSIEEDEPQGGTDEPSGPGARPLSPEELSGEYASVKPGELIDTSSWGEELSEEPASTHGRTQPQSSGASERPTARSGGSPRPSPSEGMARKPTPPRIPTQASPKGSPPEAGAAHAKSPRDLTPLRMEPLADLLEGDLHGRNTARMPQIADADRPRGAQARRDAARRTMTSLVVAVAIVLLAGGGALLWFATSRAH